MNKIEKLESEVEALQIAIDAHGLTKERLLNLLEKKRVLDVALDKKYGLGRFAI